MLKIKDEELNRINGGLIYYHKDDYFPFEVVYDDTRKHILSVGTQFAADVVAWVCGVSDQIYFNPPYC